MNEEKRIDGYFDRVKQNPPLFGMDKVNQILNKAKTEVKVEKGHQNLLRFTIMTSIFAIVLCTIIFWPRAGENIPISNTSSFSEKTIADVYQSKEAIPKIEKVEANYEENLIENSEKGENSDKAISIEVVHYNKLAFKPVRCLLIDQTNAYSKFEIKLAMNGDTSTTDFLKLSLRCRELNELTDGEYAYSKLIPDYRPTMSFSGDFYHQGSVQKISNGILEINHENSPNIKIKYEVELEDGQVLKGEYNGLFSLQVLEKDKIEKEKPEVSDLNIQPTDGQKFILKLTNEELTKIGFAITDSFIIYTNMFNGLKYVYGDVRTKVYELAGESGLPYTNNNGIRYYNNYERLIMPANEIADNSIQNHFDFHPVLSTNLYFSNILYVNYDQILSNQFDMINDTLLPVYIPSIDGVTEERILWFTFTESLYNLLAENHKPMLDEFKRYKRAKKYHRYKDLILYPPKFSLDQTEILMLDNEHMEKLGFHFYDDSVSYSGAYKNYRYEVVFKDKQAKYLIDDKNPDSLSNQNMLAIIATSFEGIPLGSGLLPYFTSIKSGITNQLKGLIPVAVNSQMEFYGNMVFWFLPTEGFFKALPNGIGKEIKTEYNYVIAQDKSALEKPECRYFEECKNTLNVSNFKVFPNPAEENATVSFTLNETVDGSITLADLAGHQLKMLQPQTTMSAGNHRFDIDVSDVAKGIYLITLYSDKGTQTQRFIVNR